ncbi:MAG: VWA domain-containing protein, partial [Arenicellales bacterium]|nr:VWA domain-containing protein [Arenicellales bacterium]
MLALLLSQLALAAPGRPAQAPIFAAASTQPNILIVIDDSGSMGWLRGGSKKVPMLAAQDAAIAMLESLSNVRVGVGSFYGKGAELDHEIVDLDKNRAAIYKAIRNLRASGGTPLIYTLQQMGRYFAGLGGSTNPG